MSDSRNKIGAAIAGLALLGGGLIAAQPASAAQSTQTFWCDGQPLTVRTNNNNNSSEHGGWGVGIVVDGGSGHLIPTAFSGSLYDVATGGTVFEFDSAKAGGKANPNQPTITCTATQMSTLGDFAPPGSPLPPGTSSSDTVVFSVSVTAVRKG